MRALIIDDERQDRLYLAKMLAVTFPEMEIEFASSPCEALFVFQNRAVDILFLDIEMPEMTGLQMLKTLRDDHTDIPVIIVSAYDKVEFVKNALRLNVIDYLNKPVNPDELEIAVNNALQKEKTATPPPSADRISLPTDCGTMYVPAEKLLYFESNKRTTTSYFADEEKHKLLRANLSELEKILPVWQFVRVSRQYIINIAYLKFVNKKSKNITLQANGHQVELHKISPHIIERFTKQVATRN